MKPAPADSPAAIYSVFTHLNVGNAPLYRAILALFATATTPVGETPRQLYAHQRRLAGALEGPAPSGPFPCRSRLINIPTGLGNIAR